MGLCLRKISTNFSLAQFASRCPVIPSDYCVKVLSCENKDTPCPWLMQLLVLKVMLTKNHAKQVKKNQLK